MPQPEAEDREQAESLERIEHGGIPLAAERRLHPLSQGESSSFTSDLSVPAFALGQQLGLQPLSQVMGSCVYQVGWQVSYGAYSNWDGSALEELDVVTQAWNEARIRALGRLAKEASLAGADAVVGIVLSRGEHDWAEGAVDFVAVGTAVRVPGAPARATPILTDLSLQDYWKLCQTGIEPRGLVYASSCFFIRRGALAKGMQMLTFASNQEIPEYTRGLYAAREAALGRITAGVRQSGVEGIIAPEMQQTIGMQEIKQGVGEKLRGLVVTIHVSGTAVGRASQPTVNSPKLQIDLSDKGAS